MEPKISIITATYNSERTVENTIKSVLAQNYTHLEYIIIDGLSTDGTLDIVRRYEKQIATIVSEKDHGISDAFNKGIAHATGDVLCFINSDDIMLPGSLQAVADAYDGKHDIYSGNVLLENPETGYKCREVPSTNFPVVPLFCHVAHQGMFATLDAYHRFGGYDTEIRWPMDLDFLMRATRLGARFKLIDYDIACYRAGGTTTTTDIRRKKRDYLYIVRKNGGNSLQAYFFYYFLCMTQLVKAFLSIIGGDDFGQKLRYTRVVKSIYG